MDQLRAQLESEAALDITPMLTRLEAEYLQEKRNTNGTGTEAKLNYAIALTKSPNPNDKRAAIRLLSEAETPANAREVWYYQGLAHYQLQAYGEARRCADQLLAVEPNNRQGLALKELIHSDLQRDGLIGVGIAAAVVAAAAVLTIVAVRR